MIEIEPVEGVDVTVGVPGSKSYTHRLFIAAALSDGKCTITNPLKSEDTMLTLEALKRMGIRAEERSDAVILEGGGGRLIRGGEIWLGNSGTSMRLLTAVAALAQGETRLTGTPRMRERPMADMLNALEQIGVDVRSESGDGCPPIIVRGGDVRGGPLTVHCGVSSQYLSGLLLMGPCTDDGLTISLDGDPVSKPYIDMTLDVMERLGVTVERRCYQRFVVPGGRTYRHGEYAVETDISNASYFWAAAAITGGRVLVKGTSKASRQGDIRIVECLELMGCRVEALKEGVAVTGGPLAAIETDMSDMPDMVPTLAVVAAFAEGTTRISNVPHLKAKECDRLAAVATELRKMGIRAVDTGDGLEITGGDPTGAEIETYDDHRIAMCFSVAGLRVPGVRILEPHCVEKSFPTYWRVFGGAFGQRNIC